MKQLILFIIPALLTAQQEWRTWSGANDGNRNSPLKQINKSNVKQLKVAWEFHSGDADARGRTNIECTPIIVNGVMYATTPTLMAVALNAATGKELWRFEPAASRFRGVNRGMMYWKEKDDERVLYAAGSILYELNAKTGKVIESFGDGGKIDMAKDLDRDPPGAFNGATTPGVIYKDMIIIGSSVGEGPRMSASAPKWLARLLDTSPTICVARIWSSTADVLRPKGSMTPERSRGPKRSSLINPDRYLSTCRLAV